MVTDENMMYARHRISVAFHMMRICFVLVFLPCTASMRGNFAENRLRVTGSVIDLFRSKCGFSCLCCPTILQENIRAWSLYNELHFQKYKYYNSWADCLFGNWRIQFIHPTK